MKFVKCEIVNIAIVVNIPTNLFSFSLCKLQAAYFSLRLVLWDVFPDNFCDSVMDVS